MPYLLTYFPLPSCVQSYHSVQQELKTKSYVYGTILKSMRKSKIAIFPHFCFPWGHPWGNHAKCWYGKTRMMWLLDGEKIYNISLFVLSLKVKTNKDIFKTFDVIHKRDGRTPGGGIYCAYAYASRGKNCKQK